jgi:hypothetical protein
MAAAQFHRSPDATPLCQSCAWAAIPWRHHCTDVAKDRCGAGLSTERFTQRQCHRYEWLPVSLERAIKGDQMNCARCKQPIVGTPYAMGGVERFCEPCAVIEYRALPGARAMLITHDSKPSVLATDWQDRTDGMRLRKPKE